MSADIGNFFIQAFRKRGGVHMSGCSWPGLASIRQRFCRLRVTAAVANTVNCSSELWHGVCPDGLSLLMQSGGGGDRGDRL